MTEGMNVHRRYHLTSQSIAERVPGVLSGRGLEPAFSAWLLTQHNNNIWLFGVLDVASLDRLERYTSPDVLHHMSTALHGMPVYLSNSNGLRYAFLLSQPPRLPRKVEFPGSHRGEALLGLGVNGAAMSVPWSKLGHLLVAGMTGSGKSNFLRLLIYQAIGEGAQLLLASRKLTTFSLLENHASLLDAIAHEPDEYHQIVARALGEFERRNRLYSQCPGHPESLEEFNALAAKSGQEPLPRLLVILDEFNATVEASGGINRPFAQGAKQLAWMGREFGIHLIFAAQAFDKRTVGAVRDQVSTAICFRVRSGDVARNVGCAGADRLRLPGRATTDRWGPMQAYLFPKELLIRQAQPGLMLTDQEQALVQWALGENDGYLSIADIQEQMGLGPWPARKLAEEWAQRGWLVKDAQAGNKRQITRELAGFAINPSNPTNPIKPSIGPSNPKNGASNPL